MLVSPEAASVLVWSSWSGAVSVLSAGWRGQPGLALLAAVSVLLSVAFWRRPCRGWRRNADFLCALANLGAVLRSSPDRTHLCGVAAALLAFAAACAAWGVGWRRWYWLHVLFHALANGSNLYLHAAVQPPALKR